MIKPINIAAILVLLSVILFGMYYNIVNSKRVVESLSNNDNIVLMGDSIFANDIYVERGDSVGDMLQDRHGNVLVVAQDNAIINDLNYQLVRYLVNLIVVKLK
mgnify:CR=1 FL=1